MKYAIPGIFVVGHDNCLTGHSDVFSSKTTRPVLTTQGGNLPCFVSELGGGLVPGLRGPGEGGRDHVGGHHPPHLHRPLLPGPRHPPGRGEVAPLDDVEVLDLGHREGPGTLLDVLRQALAALHGNQVLGLDVADGKERLDLDLKQTKILSSLDSRDSMAEWST